MNGKNDVTNQPSTASCNLDLCSSCSLTAASPRGSLVAPCSMSLTEEAAKPTEAPISANVIPFRRKSEMRDDHVSMRSSVRDSVAARQRHPVTVFRQNHVMRPSQSLPSIGARVRYWREKRGLSPSDLAEKTGAGRASTITDLESGRTKKGTFLGKIAQVLRLRLDYLEHDEGEPELQAGTAPAPQESPHWPFSAVPLSELGALNKIERSYLESKMLEALADIKSVRRHNKKNA